MSIATRFSSRFLTRFSASELCIPTVIRREPLLSALLALAVIGIVIAYSPLMAQDKPAAAAAAHATTPVAKPALTVTTARPVSSDWPMKLSANGTIAPWQEAIIGAEVNGLRLADVRVNVGDIVKKNQVLAVFDSDTVQADIAVIRANISESEAALAEAKGNAERARQLQNTGAISAQQISQFLTAETTARARINASQAQLRVQSLRLKRTQVVAPDDGVISARNATVGAVASPGMELFRMIRKNHLEWRAEVTATELAKLKSVREVLVVPSNGAQIKGSIRMVAPTSDPQTRNTIVYVDLPIGSDAKSGMFARGDFELGNSNALSVPQQAVVVRDGFSYVFRMGGGNRVVLTRIQTGRRAGDLIEVLSGLTAESVLVASGAGFLNDGDLVAVTAAPTAASR